MPDVGPATPIRTSAAAGAAPSAAIKAMLTNSDLERTIVWPSIMQERTLRSRATGGNPESI